MSDLREGTNNQGTLMARRLWNAGLGVATFVPTVWLALMLVEPVHFFLKLDAPLLDIAFESLWPLGAVIWVVNAGLVVFYLFLIHRGQLVPQADRAFWGVLVLIVGYVAMPILYLKYIRRRPTSVTQLASTQP